MVGVRKGISFRRRCYSPLARLLPYRFLLDNLLAFSRVKASPHSKTSSKTVRLRLVSYTTYQC